MKIIPLRFTDAQARKRFGFLTLCGVGAGVGLMCLCIMSGWWIAVPPTGAAGLYALTVWDSLKPRPPHRYQHFRTLTERPEIADLARDILKEQGYLNQRQIEHLKEMLRG